MELKQGVSDSSEISVLPPQDVLNRLAISESGFVFDPASGHNFTVNETGLVLLRLLLKYPRLDQILAELNAEYDAPAREVERDVVEFISAVKEHVGV